MKRKHRLLCGVLALLLAVSLIPPAEAAGPPTVSISSGTVKAGESVTLTVSIKDNPGLATCMLYFYYDTDAFTIDPVWGISAAGNFRNAGGIVTNSIAAAKENGRYEGDAGKDGVLVLWYSSNGTNVKFNGELLTVKFTASASAANGTHTIALGYSKVDTTSDDGAKVSLITESGSITVTGGVDSSTPPTPPPETPTFADIAGHWAYDYIEDASQLGLMIGYQDRFRPDDGMTRCEFVTALWRAMGEPKAKKPSTFTDLDQNWYLEAVAWAQENNVIQGTGGAKFEPYWPVSREQVAIILHRLSGSPSGMEIMLSGTYDKLFTDSGQIHSWAKAGVYWAVYQEIYCGTASVNVGKTLSPTAPATRGQIAVMLVRYVNSQGGVKE